MPFHDLSKTSVVFLRLNTRRGLCRRRRQTACGRAMDSDSEDYCVVGTPLECEEEARGYRKKVQDLAVTKALPVHKQEATDAEGRRRFHGAFTGGFSAGYFNTVGSKEGWAPSAFRSSRDDRADRQSHVQTATDFMDEDERAELQATSLEARDDYDTFGTTAAMRAQRQLAAMEGAGARGRGGGGKVKGPAAMAPAIIPGPVPLDLVVPVGDPVGARLLKLMGWRQGKGIGRKAARGTRYDDEDNDDEDDNKDDDAVLAIHGNDDVAGPAPGADSATTTKVGRARAKRRWGSVATALIEDTPAYILYPKVNNHGVGYDPFEGAEEFRRVAEARRKAANADPRWGGNTPYSLHTFSPPPPPTTSNTILSLFFLFFPTCATPQHHPPQRRVLIKVTKKTKKTKKGPQRPTCSLNMCTLSRGRRNAQRRADDA